MDKWQLTRLQQQQQEIISLVTPLAATFIQKHHRTDKWSIHENLAHLGRYQEIFQDRVETILKETRPLFDRYQAENDPGFSPWLKLPSDELLVKMKKDRAAIATRLDSLTTEQFQLQGSHPVFGLMNIREWLSFFLLHESHHIYTLFRIIKQYQTS